MSETRYIVEWCSEIPLTPDGDHDMDLAVYEEIVARDFKHAVKLARLIVARRDDTFGAPVIEEQTRDKYGWQVCGRLPVSDWKGRLTLADFDRSFYS